MKYYKAEDVERILKELAEEPNYLHPEEDWLDGICIVETRVESLPTIEVSEDAISRDYVRLIESDEDAYYGDWNETYEKGFSDAIDKVLNAPSVVPSRSKR